MDFLKDLVQDAEFWVGVAFLVFIGLLVYLKVPGALAGVLDSRGQKIQAQLDEANQLREEAQRLLAEIKTQREAAEKTAAAMIDAAKEDAKLLLSEAKAKLQDDIKRRREMAERKIANAEAQAAAEVKAAAAELASATAEAVLTARIAGATSDPLIDQGLAGLQARFQ
ncbi:ATP F0F1 synthase subunit B [Caulobacter sp. KR2-114]|uniref:F0F1 ATP synthase subunit B family protein n=1 Tax=Caulobacter sp. KR2-114 TaxID=3400912 RepID=UPI003BFBCA26